MLVDERENVRLGRLGQFNDETDDVHVVSLLCQIRHELVDLLVNRISLGGEICRDTRAFCLGTLDDAIQKHELTASQLLQLRGGSGTHHPTGTNHARRASKVTLQSPGRSADALRRENSLTSKRLTAKGLAAASLNFGVGRVDASLHIRVHVSSGFVHPSCPGRGNRDGAHHVEVEGAEPSS